MSEKFSREIVLPGLELPSWNQFYSCPHWRERHNEVKRIRHEVRALLDPELPGIPIPVDIEVEVYRKDRHVVDADNIPAKLVIDCIRGWLIPDDDRTSIHRVTTEALYDKANPRVVVRLTSLPGAKQWDEREPEQAQKDEL